MDAAHVERKENRECLLPERVKERAWGWEGGGWGGSEGKEQERNMRKNERKEEKRKKKVLSQERRGVLLSPGT